MAYQINGTDLSTQPESGHWIDREEMGRDGNGRPIYPNPREFEMKWGFISVADLNQMQTFFNAVGSTGTVVVSLPQYGASSYQFYAYSGCILSEVTIGAYFEQFVSDVRLLVSKVIG